MLGAVVLGCVALWLLWWPAAEPARYELLAGGHEVKDHRTGPVWRRCAEGQRWDGTHCAGEALLMPHLVAIAHAASQPGWRLCPSCTAGGAGAARSGVGRGGVSRYATALVLDIHRHHQPAHPRLAGAFLVWASPITPCA